MRWEETVVEQVPRPSHAPRDPSPGSHPGGLPPSSASRLRRLVGEGGLEPPHPYGHRNLNPARLPIPPLARVEQRAYLTSGRGGPAKGPCQTIVPRAEYAQRSTMGLQQFERRLERMVEGVFARAFRGSLQPVEIARRLTREMDLRRTIAPKGTLTPNEFVVLLSPADRARFAPIEDELISELEDVARDH